MYPKLRKLWDIFVSVLFIVFIAVVLIALKGGRGDERASDPKYQEYLRSGSQIDYTYEEWLRIGQEMREYYRDLVNDYP